MKKKVLVIEDDLILQKALNVELLSAGFGVITSIDGKAGLDAIKIFKPDVILLNIIIPVLDGFEVLEIISKDKKKKMIPVIVLATSDDERDKKRCKKLGAVDYFVKIDTKIQDLIQRISEIVNKKRKS